MFQLLILCLTAAIAMAVSNPEISSQSGKSNQQQGLQKAPNDESLLNSINAYAQQYESISKPYQPGSVSTQLFAQHFTPSQQQTSTPTLETNFQPIPSARHHQQQHIQAQAQSPPTPVIMQYLPQTQTSDGVQYLQLIPTRPLIVPISPYMQQAYQTQQLIQPQLTDYSGRAILTAEHDPVNSIHYGIQGYANNLQNYRSYRFNREAKPNSSPHGTTLNLHEYMPSPHDAPKLIMIRGRP